jgi:integrator complex subunit 6
MSLLDCAKAAVEHYLKQRSRDAAAFRMEMHFLVSFAPGLAAIRCGWHNTGDLMTELKALKAEHVSDVGAAVRKALDLVNM